MMLYDETLTNDRQLRLARPVNIELVLARNNAYVMHKNAERLNDQIAADAHLINYLYMQRLLTL